MDTPRALLARASPFTLLLSYLIPGNARSAFRKWYAYLRWADDQVDEAPEGAVSAQLLLLRQFQLLDGSPPADILTDQERLLEAVMTYDRTRGGDILVPLIRDMLECIQFDAVRRGRTTAYNPLRDQWRKEVRAYLGAIAFFCGERHDGNPQGLRGAEGAKIVHILRDFHEDVATRQINISREELAASGLIVECLSPCKTDIELGSWAAANARAAAEMLAQGLQELRTCSRLRYKLIVILLISKYQCYANAILRKGLCPDHTLSPWQFLAQFGRNLAVVFAGAPAARRRVGFSPVVRPTLRSRLMLLSALVPWGNRAETDHLQQTLGVAASSMADLKPVRRRFRVACLMGRTSFALIAPSAACMRDVTQVAGLLYGYWSIGAIELDRLMDEAILSPSQAQMAADEWLRQLHGTLFGAAPLANEKTIPNSSSDVFGALTSAFMRTLQTYDTLCRNRQFPHWDVDVRKSFYHATAGLLAGQMRSLRQMEPDDAQGWPWYRASILNSKNVQFLLAPLNLWRVEEGSEKHLSRFMRQFECLNRTYLHYQLIDDVADLAEDTAQGIVGAPAAILFSQGALAREALRYTEGAQLGNSISNNRMLVEAIRNSELLAEGLAGAPPFDRFRQCFRGGVQCSSDGEDYLRCALGNCEADLSLTISALAQRRDEEAQAFLEALQQRQFGPAQSYLLRSGAPNRILNAVGNDSAIIALRRALDEDIASAGSQLLYILESLMRKTHRAALSVVRHGND